MQFAAPTVFWSISSATRCPETGAFRFVFDVAGAEVSADLTVCWLEDKGAAFLRFIAVDRVYGADRALERAIEAWVARNQDAVLSTALEVA